MDVGRKHSVPTESLRHPIVSD